jgi:regulator of RNase E activity RraA
MLRTQITNEVPCELSTIAGVLVNPGADHLVIDASCAESLRSKSGGKSADAGEKVQDCERAIRDEVQSNTSFSDCGVASLLFVIDHHAAISDVKRLWASP